MSAPEPPAAGIAEELSFKNRLQQYMHRASISLPVYQTFNEGALHERRFKTRVWVDGTCFTSPNTFPTRKMSEQDAAKHALIGIQEKVKNEGPSRVLENTIFCKSIINEYALKINIKPPTYVTNATKVMLPIFVSSLVLNDGTFVGDAAKNKKEAEQLAARSAILSILESESTTTMSEIVKSKFKFYDALKVVKDSSIVQAGNVPAGTTACAPLEHVNGGSSDVQTINMPTGVKQLEHSDITCVGNKRKEVHSTNLQCGDVGDEVDPLKNFNISSVAHDGNVTTDTNPLEDSGATFSVNKRTKVHPSSVLPSNIRHNSDPLEHANGSSVVQIGDVLGGTNTLVENDAASSIKKRKEDHTSPGTITGPFAVNPNPSFLAQVPFHLMHPECALAQLPLETKNPESQSSSVTIAIAPQIATVPPALALEQPPPALDLALEQPPPALEQTPLALEQPPPALEQTPLALEQPPPALEQPLVSSNSGKKRNRKNRKARKKAQDQSRITVLPIPQTQIPTQLLASSGLCLS